MESARGWAESNGWSYRFLDDDLFTYVPGTIRTKLSNRPSTMADIARLIWSKQVLSGDDKIERVIWLDADVFVFAPQHIRLDGDLNFAVGRQNWVQPDLDRNLKVFRQVHNAILLFTRQTPVLDFLIQSVTTMAERMDRVSSPQMFGPKLLTALHNIVGFTVIEEVGMASPLVLSDIASGGGPALTRLVTDSAASLGALNLCSSYRGETVDGITCNDALFEKTIEALENQCAANILNEDGISDKVS